MLDGWFVHDQAVVRPSAGRRRRAGGAEGALPDDLVAQVAAVLVGDEQLRGACMPSRSGYGGVVVDGSQESA